MAQENETRSMWLIRSLTAGTDLTRSLGSASSQLWFSTLQKRNMLNSTRLSGCREDDGH